MYKLLAFWAAVLGFPTLGLCRDTTVADTLNSSGGNLAAENLTAKYEKQLKAQQKPVNLDHVVLLILPYGDKDRFPFFMDGNIRDSDRIATNNGNVTVEKLNSTINALPENERYGAVLRELRQTKAMLQPLMNSTKGSMHEKSIPLARGNQRRDPDSTSDLPGRGNEGDRPPNNPRPARPARPEISETPSDPIMDRFILQLRTAGQTIRWALWCSIPLASCYQMYQFADLRGIAVEWWYTAATAGLLMTAVFSILGALISVLDAAVTLLGNSSRRADPLVILLVYVMNSSILEQARLVLEIPPEVWPIIPIEYRTLPRQPPCPRPRDVQPPVEEPANQAARQPAQEPMDQPVQQDNTGEASERQNATRVSSLSSAGGGPLSESDQNFLSGIERPGSSGTTQDPTQGTTGEVPNHSSITQDPELIPLPLIQSDFDSRNFDEEDMSGTLWHDVVLQSNRTQHDGDEPSSGC